MSVYLQTAVFIPFEVIFPRFRTMVSSIFYLCQRHTYKMEKPSLLLLFVCMVPLFTALTGTIIEAISLQDSVTVREKKVKQMLMCYFLSFVGIGSGVSTGLAVPEIAVYLWPLTVLSLNIAPVLYYRSAVILTDTGNKESRFISPHYLFPVLSGVFCLLLTLCLPVDTKLHLILGSNVDGYTMAWVVYRSVPVIQFVLCAIYMSLAVRILATCYQNNKEKNPELWKKWLQLSYTLALLAAIWSGAFSLTFWTQTGKWVLPIAATAAWVQAMYLCCFTFNRRSLIFLPLSISPVPLRMPSVEQLPAENPTGRNQRFTRWNRTGDPMEVEVAQLNKKIFEQYVVGKKMFLNPHLRLTDLMEVFNTNRSYLSRFINDTYGCGFNGYINRLRLKELERLMKLPSNRGKTVTRLYPKAGFGNYQVYLRIHREVRGNDAPRTSDKPINPDKP